MKEKRKVPVRDTIKLLWAMDRKFPVIVILQGGLNALLFYLPVLLVARILDLLVYRENSADPVSIAVVGLVGIWLLKGVEYYGTAEPPVRCGESHLSGLTEPLHFVY